MAACACIAEDKSLLKKVSCTVNTGACYVLYVLDMLSYSLCNKGNRIFLIDSDVFFFLNSFC